MNGVIDGICTSDRKGIPKTGVQSVTVNAEGIVGDAHAGDWHRQVSALGGEQIDAFKVIYGEDLPAGQFGENLILRGIALEELSVGHRLRSGEVVLEVTQIGKECHDGCAISKRVGTCIMPTKGLFFRVVSPGSLTVGDAVEVEQP